MRVPQVKGMSEANYNILRVALTPKAHRKTFSLVVLFLYLTE
jgi:hypothetical protein